MSSDTVAPSLPRLLKAEEVSERIGEPVWRIYQLAREGHMPSIHFGRSLRFDPSALAEWLAAGGTASNGA